MKDGDQHSHREAFAQAPSIANKVGNHHRLAVARTQRVHEAVTEGHQDREPERLRASIVTEAGHGSGEDQGNLCLPDLEPAMALEGTLWNLHLGEGVRFGR